jgi:mannose-6-phosphate isomerase
MAELIVPVVRVAPVARDYAWGSPRAIPELLGQPPTGAPIAELWFGAHPDSPSMVEGDPLDQLIAADPARLLGPAVAAAYGDRLPFLVKILAAARPLSIQVHPTRAQAAAGFADEQARGIAIDAPERNYRDANHKPELLFALTEFDALCGFRPVAVTLELLDALAVADLDPVRVALSGADPLRTAFGWLLERDATERARLVASVRASAARLARSSAWPLVAQAVLQADAEFPDDVGVLLALLLNAVRLAPGEAIYLGAGNVHAYLRGMGVEVMANSDNVLRCGLTPKHIDVDEVMRVADFTALVEPRCRPDERGAGEVRFAVAVPDFELSMLDVGDRRASRSGGPQLLLCTAGAVFADAIGLGPGQAVFAAAGSEVALTGNGRIVRATVGSGVSASVRP